MDDIKTRVVNYWARRAEGFKAQRLREWQSPKRAVWRSEIHPHLPRKKPLTVLDIGTGTGFFACLLAAEGHDVTGIDMTPEMIEKARDMASLLQVTASFRAMDAEVPDFAAESFDVLVTRNLTWTLPDLPKAYRSWYRLLKKGGVLLNFDADYCADLAKETREHLPEIHAHRTLSETMIQESHAITKEIGKRQQPRPSWDKKLLRAAGFSDIFIDEDAYQRIYQEKDEFYHPAAVFLIAAHKKNGVSPVYPASHRKHG